MNVRRRIAFVLLVALSVVVGSALGGRVGDLSDSSAWQTLPWVLLAVFWLAVGFAYWRRRVS